MYHIKFSHVFKMIEIDQNGNANLDIFSIKLNPGSIY